LKDDHKSSVDDIDYMGLTKQDERAGYRLSNQQVNISKHLLNINMTAVRDFFSIHSFVLFPVLFREENE
jgi:hypothetical protein